MRSLLRFTAVILVVASLAGCDPAKETEDADSNAPADNPPRASVTLRVAVVSDPAIARVLDRLRGEWNSLTDGVTEVTTIEAVADLASAAAETDLIVFPSRRLGDLCEAGALRPVRKSVLKSEKLRFSDYLPLVRDHEVVYAQQPMALPLGCPAPLLLAPEGAEPTDLALPEDDHRLALAYLAWAAPHAVHRSRAATLFDLDDFTPRLTSPPFVRALESLVSAAGEGPTRIAWPERDAPLPDGTRLVPIRIPGADEAYNTLADEWEKTRTGDRHATLIASSGALIAVTKSTRNAATAFRYAAWIAAPENTREVAMASDSVANCRGSFARSADAWLDSPDRALGREFAAAGAEALRTPRFLLTPRLPGTDEYLAALGAEVRATLEGAPAGESLGRAAAAWQAITDHRGKEAQHAAYRRSINASR